MTESTEHLDLDALADVLAGEPEPAHLAACASCRAQLAELEAALPQVSRALAGAPVPAMPDDLPARIEARLAEELTDEAPAPIGGDVLPMTRRRTRWLPSLTAVAAAAILVTSAVLLTHHDHKAPGTASAATDSGYAVNDSGADYTKASLPGALPLLLKGDAKLASGVTASREAATKQYDSTQQQAPVGPGQAPAPLALGPGQQDPLAPLRTTTGLARCLASLTDPGDTGLPLALDYASFEGHPALVVVLPSQVAGKVDVFVVPPGCARADGALFYFTRLPKP